MNKIEKLEKRIEKLEEQLKKVRSNEMQIGTSLLNVVDPDSETRVQVEEKYSEGNLPANFKQFDLNKAIKEASKKGDASRKLAYWTTFFINLGTTKFSKTERIFFEELYCFALHAKQYYENIVIERLLEEGRYYEGRGNKPQWNEMNSIAWWNELSNDKNYLKCGRPMKTKIYDEIRRRHNPKDPNQKNGVPASPTEKTIRNHLQKAGRIEKRK